MAKNLGRTAKNLGRTVVLLAGLAALIPAAKAADLEVHARHAMACSRIWSCAAGICAWHRVCYRGCPDGYGCYPLYGAYGPYGGAAYWSSLTEGAPPPIYPQVSYER
jgi:hypothetical protein